MTINTTMILDIWDLLSEYVPTAKKEDAANKLLIVLDNYSIDSRDLQSIHGEDQHLDAAIKHLYGHDDVEEENDEDEELF